MIKWCKNDFFKLRLFDLQNRNDDTGVKEESAHPKSSIRVSLGTSTQDL